MYEYIDITRWMRLGRIACFGVLVLGGSVGFFLPSYVVASVASKPVAIAWAVSFVTAALLCMVSAITKRTALELVGLPLLIACVLFHCVCAVFSYELTDFHTNLYMSASIDLAFAIGLFNRFQALRILHTPANTD
jgi:hypothetical protein